MGLEQQNVESPGYGRYEWVIMTDVETKGRIPVTIVAPPTETILPAPPKPDAS
jgi:hypothetical protein